MTPGRKRVVLVAAVAENGVIGNGPDIPWSIPGEQAEFKRLTTGNVLLMGRTTYESIGRPLPGRTTIVLTRDESWTAGEHADRVHVAHTLADAYALADRFPGDVMVAGGAQVYAAAMASADAQVLSRVPLSPEGDVHYPEFDLAEWIETSRDVGEAYDRVWLTRRPASRASRAASA
jgi:dihydrofolate reductase